MEGNELHLALKLDYLYSVKKDVERMKVDLHCHTRKIKTGDGEGREVSPEKFRAKVLESNVKIIAITNHRHLL